MKLANLTEPSLITTDLKSSGKNDVLAELGALLSSKVAIDSKIVTRILVERERLATTGIGEGVAIPHGKLDGLEGMVAAIGLSRTGILFDAVDGAPVHIFVALLAPSSGGGDHLKALGRLSKLLKSPEVRARLVAERSPLRVYHALVEEDARLI
ncbi:MAG: PTS sugar transporter subunit IIA [Myxococcota bacterium]|jgi:PTS system nitrogen regulatory IIA component|nr:PTS sugar transporter subunit IIA [Myxococcota bacterium]